MFGVRYDVGMDNTFTHNYPTLITIFGGTGDLAQTKLLSSLFHLYAQHKLPTVFTILGLSRKDLSNETYREFVKECLIKKDIDIHTEVAKEFCSHIQYMQGDIDAAASYASLAERLRSFDSEIGQCTNKLFYLAVPPPLYSTIFTHIHESNLMSLCDGEGSWSRLLVEKPFGRDLETAQSLEKQLCTQFKEEQIYRIDHYLAKDAIENIMALRFSNGVLSDSWNGAHIESITIRLFESKDVSNRGAFYDSIGTLRDVGQNHLLQMFALLTMDRVDVYNATTIRHERAKALKALMGSTSEKLIRGQYAGYQDTNGVAPGSQTETYFRIESILTHDTWNGVRLVLESGKALDRNVTEALITFRAQDPCNCRNENDMHYHHNVLKIVFSPDEQMSLSMWMKRPGFDQTLQEKEFILMHTKGVDEHSPEAYERVLYDCIIGDQTRFVSGEEVVAAWEFMTPIMEKMQTLPLQTYDKSTCALCVVD